nr:CD177 antigen-like isoform X2 [Arvicanthis niloticus]
MKLGQNFSKAAIEWPKNTTVSIHGDRLMCQETLVLIDVGENSLMIGSKGSIKDSDQTQNIQVFSAGPGIVAASYVHFCDTELCNNADSTSVLLNNLSLSAYNEPGTIQCDVCLNFGSLCKNTSILASCPMETKCYAGTFVVNRGGISTFFDIFGCLSSSYTYLFKNQTSIGILGIKETLKKNNTTSFSHVLVPSTLPVWMLGLRALLSPLCAGICPLC